MSCHHQFCWNNFDLRCSCVRDVVVKLLYQQSPSRWETSYAEASSMTQSCRYDTKLMTAYALNANLAMHVDWTSCDLKARGRYVLQHFLYSWKYVLDSVCHHFSFFKLWSLTKHETHKPPTPPASQSKMSTSSLLKDIFEKLRRVVYPLHCRRLYHVRRLNHFRRLKPHRRRLKP